MISEHEHETAALTIPILSPVLAEQKLAQKYTQIAHWLDTPTVIQYGQRKGWSVDQTLGEQLGKISEWCQELSRAVKSHSIQLAWIHDMIGKLGLISKVPFRNVTEWMTSSSGMSIDAALLQFAINQYGAWQAIESYNIPEELVQEAMPIQLQRATQVVEEAHRQYDDLASRKIGGKRVEDLPWEEQKELYDQVDAENRAEVRKQIIEALQTEPNMLHEEVAQHGGLMDKPCFHHFDITFDPVTMTAEGRWRCSFNPNQVRSLKLGKCTDRYQINGESLTPQQYARHISDLIR